MQRAGGGQKIVVGVFSANARLNRVADDFQLMLLLGQGPATGHQQLPAHQVFAGNGFGHRVLDLQTGVHLHEVKLHGFGRIVATGLLDNEFHRARAHVVHGLGGGYSGFAHLLAQRFGHARSGSFFQHFLVAALY